MPAERKLLSLSHTLTHTLSRSHTHTLMCPAHMVIDGAIVANDCNQWY